MRPRYVTKLVFAAAVMSLLTSCNGSDSGSDSPGIYFGTPSPLTGIYEGAQSLSGPPAVTADGFVGAVAPNGTGYFASTGSVLIIPGLVSSTSTASTGTYLPSDPSLNLGVGSNVLRLYFQINSYTSPLTVPISVATTLADTLFGIIGPVAGASILLHTNTARLAASVTPALPTSTTSYQGFYFGSATAVSLKLDAGGNLSGKDALGCNIAGVVVPVRGSNEYQVSANVTGPASCAGGIYGVAFALQDVDYTGAFSGAAGTYLYIVTANTDFTKAFAVEVR